MSTSRADDAEADASAKEIRSAERRLMWKVDLWILPTLTTLFILSFIDKVNIANAKIFGLTEELHLEGSQFSTCLIVYFVAYVVFDVPCTILILKVGPHIWLSIITFIFGILAMCQGFVTTYGGLLALRFLLGVAESSSFSCCFLVIGKWYKRVEAQKRFTFFYSSIQLAGAFQGLLASAIGLLHGAKGYAGWRWIFIIEGSFTAAIAIPFFFVLPDFPQNTKWLSAENRRLILERLDDEDNANQHASKPSAELSPRLVIRTILKPKTLLVGLIYFMLTVPAYAYQFFAPTIIHTYTSGAIRSQLLSVPPWACGFVASLAIAALSDGIRHRFLFATLPQLLAVTGYAVLLAVHENSHARYAAMFLIVLGIWIPFPIIVCWVAMNVTDNAQRSIVLGYMIGFGNIGGIPAGYLFFSKDAPDYTTGFSTCLAFIASCSLFNCVYAVWCRWENQKIEEKGIEDVAEHGTIETRTVNREDRRLKDSKAFNMI